jgi:hypothetical protein
MAVAAAPLKRPPTRIDLAAGLRAAAAAGKPVGRTLFEMARARFGRRKLTAAEYIYFRLFETKKDRKAQRRYLGLTAQKKLFRKTTDSRYTILADDKLVWQGFLQGFGHPLPVVRALLRTPRRFGDMPHIDDAAALAGFLESARFPLFLKPVAGLHSVGTLALRSFDPAAQAAIGFDGRAWSAAELLAAAGQARGGLIVQDFLEPHEAVQASIGRRLATLRLVVLVGRQGPRLYRAMWKVPVAPHMADNFWLPGNLLAAVDRDRGTITRVIRGHGVALEEVEDHPDTGARLLGSTVPLWSEVLATTLEAAADVPGIGVQAWDVGITARGPVLVELNVGGDVTLPQLAHDEGLMTDEFSRFLAERTAR